MNALPTEAIGADRIAAVEDYLTGLQDRICAAIEGVDGGARFHEDRWQRAEGGGGRSRVLRDGHVFEQAGIGFSRVEGARMPASATAHRPELADKAWVAMGVSLVFHPRNPYIPTTHMNVRMFIARGAGAPGHTATGAQTAPATASTHATTASSAPAAWYADPSGRYELRYWNGREWTEHVARGGQQYTDPPRA